MLSRWFDRGGLGQLLAPDESVAQRPPEPDEATGAFWQFVAPDPKFQQQSEPPVKAPPAAAFLSHPSGTGSNVQCVHCKKWTPIQPTDTPDATRSSDQGLPTPISSNKLSKDAGIYTPTKSNPSFGDDELKGLVLSAAKDTAMSMTSPTTDKDTRDRVFRLAASSKPLKATLIARLRKLLEKNPTLIYARSTHLGNLVPDGYTPLMAAAHADHVSAAEIILELSPNAYLERDLQGRTPLHIASELGNLKMVNLLNPLFQKKGFCSPPPVDLLGRTPLGRAVTSPNPNARKCQKELEKVLFSPGDVSVCGNPKPGGERTAMDVDLKLAYGVADMPGFRVTMEDAVCSSLWQQNGQSFCLMGVCDGHGDRGVVSQFIADQAPYVLQSHLDKQDGQDWNEIWKKTCKDLDAGIKQAELIGGSTAVLALITSDSIIVANVGDSRSILIQKNEISGLEKRIEKTSIPEMQPSETDNQQVKAEDENPTDTAAKDENPTDTAAKDENPTDTAPDMDTPQENDAPEVKEDPPAVPPSPQQKGPVVLALSEDHKPNLEKEQVRIEKAGMKVVPITFEEDGKETTIYKVQKSAKDQMAVSRAFGDFEYKCNTTIGEDEQAVISVPDVCVHRRDPYSDMYLVLACDGVWDVMSNEDVAKYVVPQIEARVEMSDAVLPEVGDALLNECLQRGSRDNMTVAIVALSKAAETISAGPLIHGRALTFSSP